MSTEQSAGLSSAGAKGPVHTGGCLCGAVRYRVEGDPVAVSICHCVNCQRNSGSAFSVNVIFPKGAMTVEGEPAIFEDHGDTGAIVQRFFCGTCGTPLESRSVFSAPNHTVIKGGSFDDPGAFVPDSELYCRSALPWWTDGAPRKRYAELNTEAVAAAVAAAKPDT